jgi:lysophospholipase L1-like esterase
MSKNFFEKNSKLILFTINLVFIALVFLIINLDIFQDAPNAEKYSIFDRLQYQLRCAGKRNIVLRENSPNLNEVRIPPYDKTKKYQFRTDENGFIKPSKIYDNADLNIFFLGGSTTECEYVDENYRFPYLVGRILEEKTGKKINSYNVGKSGNNSIHSINNLLNKIAPLNPNIVVRMEAINDLSTLLYEATYWNKNRSRSNLGCFSKNNDLLRNFRNEWEFSPYKDMITNKVHQDRIKKEYYKIVTIFVAITKSIGAKPVLMTQVNMIVKNPDFSVKKDDKQFNEAYRKLYRDFQNITRQIAKENNVLLIDLSKEIVGDREYLYDSVHLNNEGSKLVANIIAEKIQNHFNLKK